MKLETLSLAIGWPDPYTGATPACCKRQQNRDPAPRTFRPLAGTNLRARSLPLRLNLIPGMSRSLPKKVTPPLDVRKDSPFHFNPILADHRLLAPSCPVGDADFSLNFSDSLSCFLFVAPWFTPAPAAIYARKHANCLPNTAFP